MSASAPDVALMNTAHLYARVSEKERLLRFFTEVLGLPPREVTVAYVTAKQPMYAVTFANGAGLSVEFTDDALDDVLTQLRQLIGTAAIEQYPRAMQQLDGISQENFETVVRSQLGPSEFMFFHEINHS